MKPQLLQAAYSTSIGETGKDLGPNLSMQHLLASTEPIGSVAEPHTLHGTDATCFSGAIDMLCSTGCSTILGFLRKSWAIFT
jgi:hypothetical protein